MFSEFLRIIESNQLLFEGCKIVAAVSGGADSMCLLHLLYRLRKIYPFHLTCAHVNHMIREEADEDALFVERICFDWNIPFVIYKTNVLNRSKTEKISVELAGREERYSFLKSLNADFIMTAHNKNDVAESILLHMIRGCGLPGLCGIPIKREDGIVRPMLNFTRQEIEDYLLKYNINWCEDSTNSDIHYTRNKIRHEILPQLLEINPSFLDGVRRLTDILSVENNFLVDLTSKCTCITEENGMHVISLPLIQKMHIALQRRAINRLLENWNDVNSVLELMNKQTGKSVVLSGGKIAQKEYNQIVIYSKKPIIIEPVLLPEKGIVHFGSYTIIVGDEGLPIPKRNYLVRTKKPGDKFMPEGMSGHKKIKDFLIEKKIPKREREDFPLIISENQIASVSDLRRDASFVPKNEPVIKIKVLKK